MVYNCLELLDVAEYLCKNIGDIGCTNAICRTILNRCYYAEYNYLIQFAIENGLQYQAMGGSSSHKNTIDSITHQMREKFPNKRKLISAIRRRMMTAKEQRQRADYYYGGSQRYDDVILVPPKHFVQYVKEARKVCNDIDKVAIVQ